jgi:hypothetical protein
MALAVHIIPVVRWLPERPAAHPRLLPDTSVAPARRIECADPEDEEEDLGDEEDLAVAQPLADEESNFDDFDDEFDDDFEEEENDPDWDHPDDGDGEEPPAGKGPTRRK